MDWIGLWNQGPDVLVKARSKERYRISFEMNCLPPCVSYLQ